MLNNLSAEVYLLPLVGLLYVACGLRILHMGKSCGLIVKMSSVGGCAAWKSDPRGRETSQQEKLGARQQSVTELMWKSVSAA